MKKNKPKFTDEGGNFKNKYKVYFEVSEMSFV